MPIFSSDLRQTMGSLPTAWDRRWQGASRRKRSKGWVQRKWYVAMQTCEQIKPQANKDVHACKCIRAMQTNASVVAHEVRQAHSLAKRESALHRSVSSSKCVITWPGRHDMQACRQPSRLAQRAHRTAVQAVRWQGPERERVQQAKNLLKRGGAARGIR